MENDELLMKYSKFYNMNMVCSYAGVSYKTYRNWKSSMQNMSDEKIQLLLEAMIDIAYEIKFKINIEHLDINEYGYTLETVGECIRVYKNGEYIKTFSTLHEHLSKEEAIRFIENEIKKETTQNDE